MLVEKKRGGKEAEEEEEETNILKVTDGLGLDRLAFFRSLMLACDLLFVV
jgi:hypothetical protein